MKRLSFVRKSELVFFVLLFAFSLASAACGGGGGDEDENFSLDACSAIGLKVANGQQCSVDEDPSASSIVRLTILNLDGSVANCTGVALDSFTVLTAGHCFLAGPVNIQVDTFAGAFPGATVVVHPDFSVDTEAGLVANDVALVLTNEPMNISVSPILLSRAPVVGEEAIVAGFGETAPGSGIGSISAGNALVALVTPQHVFIEFQGNQSHPCLGDSGGPLLVSVGGTLAITGVVSQSDPSIDPGDVCEPGDVTLYTNIQNSAVQDFLAQHIPTMPVL